MTIVIGTKLKLTSEGAEALEHFKHGFESIDEKAKEVTHEFANMARQAVATAVGFQIYGGIESIKEFGHELVAGAAHLEDQQKELRGLISLTDKGEMSMDELSERAAGLNERLEGLALSSRTSKESLVDAFEMIAQRTTGTSAHVEDMVGKMAIAARALPGGMETIAAGWRDIESGMVRPKNALLLLMKQTGVIEGPLKKVAKGINAMLQTPGGQEKVFQLAETAIDRMSRKMKDAPPTLGQVVASLHDVREMAFETMGMPILRSIVPPLERVRQYLVGHREELVRLAETMGRDVGQWVTKAAALAQEGFEYVRDHATEIAEAFEQGATAIKDAIAFMVAHRELILGLAAAKLVGGPLGGAAGTVASMLPGLGAMAGKAVGGMTTSLGLPAGGAPLAFAVTAAAATAATTAWVVAAQQASKLEGESGLSVMQMLDHMETGLGELAKASDNMLNFQASLRRLNDEEKNVATSNEEIERFITNIERSGQVAVEAGDMTLAEYEKVLAAANRQAEAHARVEGAFDNLNAAATQALGVGGLAAAAQAIPNLSSAYQQAAKESSDAANKAARDILSANQNLVTALVGGPGTVEMALKKLQSLASGADEKGVKLPPIQFGPNTINIRQDFRDQDPDRVAIVFRRDAVRQAVSRIGARTGSPFGF